MAIYRHTHESCFTVLPNALIRDSDLSLRDVGLLVYLLSLPEDWEFSMRGMEAVLARDGKESLRAAVLNLEARGYIRRCQSREKNGRMTRGDWDVTDIPGEFAISPVSALPMSEKPMSEKPTSVNPTQTKKLPNKETTQQRNDQQSQASEGFEIPERIQLRDYFRQQNLKGNADAFYEYYAALDWKPGGKPIRNWKALARSWSAKERNDGNGMDAEDDLPYIWKPGYEM